MKLIGTTMLAASWLSKVFIILSSQENGKYSCIYPPNSRKNIHTSIFQNIHIQFLVNGIRIHDGENAAL